MGGVAGMDFTVPYTFYPLALPHWIAWTLFLAAVTAGAGVGAVTTWSRGWKSGVLMGAISLVLFLVVTMGLAMVITFFVHDV
jgi:formate-dependent nitrite reductase membrane component NrfD